MSSFSWHLWWESCSIKGWNVGRHELCLCPMSSDMPILEGLLWAPVQLNFFICFNRLQCFLAIILCFQVVVIKVIKSFKIPSKVTKYLFFQKETLVSLCFVIQWDFFSPLSRTGRIFMALKTQALFGCLLVFFCLSICKYHFSNCTCKQVASNVVYL